MIIDCIIRKLFHIYCPGCGGTRAVYQLLQFHILKSLYLNPVPICMLISMIVLLYTYRLKKKVGISSFYFRIRIVTAKITLCIIFLNFTIKNILLLVFKMDLLGNFM